MNFNQLGFAVYSIGLVASKLNMNQTDVYDRLKKSGILGGYLVKGYDALHTFSSDYIADDLIDYRKFLLDEIIGGLHSSLFCIYPNSRISTLNNLIYFCGIMMEPEEKLYVNKVFDFHY